MLLLDARVETKIKEQPYQNLEKRLRNYSNPEIENDTEQEKSYRSPGREESRRVLLKSLLHILHVA